MYRHGYARRRKTSVMCQYCHQPLTDSLSGHLGSGPICRLNLKVADGTHRCPFPRACYDYEIVNGVICVVDNDRGRSVTNDARKVIADLFNDGIGLSMPVIYRDSEGIWDRLLVVGGKFAGFSPVGATTRDEAIQRLSMEVM